MWSFRRAERDFVPSQHHKHISTNGNNIIRHILRSSKQSLCTYIAQGPDNVVGYIHRSVIGNKIGSSSRRNTVLGLFGSRYSEKLNKLIFVNKQQKLCKVEISTTLAVCVTNSEEWRCYCVVKRKRTWNLANGNIFQRALCSQYACVYTRNEQTIIRAYKGMIRRMTEYLYDYG